MSACIATLASAEVFTVDGIRYSVTDDVAQTVSVVGWDKDYFAEISTPTNPTVGTVDEDMLGPENLVLSWRVLYNGLYYRVNSIDDDAFSECLSIKTITIPNSVEEIGSYAFQGCLNLISVQVQWITPIEIDESVFDGIDLKGSEDDPDSGVKLFVLQGYDGVYRAAEVWKDFKTVSTYQDFDINMVFVDPYVKEICVANWDTDGDGELTYREARSVTDLGAAFVGDPNITSFDEFRSFGFVTSVGQACFKGCTNLTSITFPPSITNVGQEAFYGCKVLENVVLQSRVTTIGDRAFYGCGLLKNLSLPLSLRTIGDHAFDGCASIKMFHIQDYVNSIGEGAFANCSSLTRLDVSSVNKNYVHNSSRNIILDKASRTQFVAYAQGLSATSYELPETVMEILPYAFAGAGNLASVKLNNVEIIGHDAFANCGKLYTLTIPDKVTTIGENAFAGVAKGIRVQVTWPAPLSIGPQAFSHAADADADGINGRLFVPAGTKEAYAAADGWSWFNFIEEGTIADYAAKIIQFADPKTAALCVAAYDADHDGYVTIDEAAAVSSLGETFKGAELGSFDELKYFTGLTSIDDEAFMGSTLTKVTLPEGLTTIGARAFADCASLTVFNVPASVVNIGNGAFKGCSSLTAINVDAENPSYSSGTSGVLFTKDHTTLIQYPSKKSSTSVTIPDGVETIEPEAFAGAQLLQGVTIGSTVSVIGERAFADCPVLKTVKTFWATPLDVPANTFEGVDLANATLNVPNGADAAYQAAEVWKEFGTTTTFKLFVIFDDPNVEKICVEHWDTNGDGKLAYAEATAITSIGDVFKGNTDITSFKELAEFTKVTEIPDEAFMGCTSLAAIGIPYVTRIGKSAFEGCSVLKMPPLPTTLKEYGERAFFDCDGLTTVNIHPNIQVIGDGAFSNCSSLTGFNFVGTNPNYVGLNGIIFTKDSTEVVIYPAGKSTASFTVTKDHVKTIHPYAFSGANKLKNLNLHHIETIGAHAFEYCDGLTQVTFTEGQRTIGDYPRASAPSATTPSATATTCRPSPSPPMWSR